MPTRAPLSLVLAGLLLGALMVPDALARAATAPNILIILSADQRHDTTDDMPRARAPVFAEGLSFTKAYVTTPLWIDRATRPRWFQSLLPLTPDLHRLRAAPQR